MFKQSVIAMAALIGACSIPMKAQADAVSAVEAIKQEPRVKDMLYQPRQAIKWQIGVISDGTPQFGFASYICELLREHGVVTGSTPERNQVVRVVDIVKVTQGSNFRKASLGAVDCATYKQMMP